MVAVAVAAMAAGCSGADGTDNSPIPAPQPAPKYVTQTYCTYGNPYLRYTFYSDGTSDQRIGYDC